MASRATDETRIKHGWKIGNPRWCDMKTLGVQSRKQIVRRDPSPPHPTLSPEGRGQDEMAVRCRNVTKRFGAADSGTWALRGIDLEVLPGQMTLLVGPSGCGKTTLISSIAGLLNPTAGEVAVLGRDLGGLSNGGLVRFRQKNIGFVFQQYNLLPALTAAEHAAIPLVIAGRPRRQAVEAAAAVL